MHGVSTGARFAEALLAGLAAEAEDVQRETYDQFYQALITDVMTGGMLAEVRWSALERERLQGAYFTALLAMAIADMEDTLGHDPAVLVKQSLGLQLRQPSAVTPHTIGDDVRDHLTAVDTRNADRSRRPCEAVAVRLVHQLGFAESKHARAHFADPRNLPALSRHMAVAGSGWWQTVKARMRPTSHPPLTSGARASRPAAGAPVPSY